MEKFAAIDIGSNAIRIMIGHVDESGSISSFFKNRSPVRLGADVFTHGKILPSTSIKAVEALRQYSEVIQAQNALATKAVATSAVRNAKNGKEFVETVAAKTGVQIEVISSRQEAEHIHTAICHTFYEPPKSALFLDIGGGSLEITLSINGRIEKTIGLPLGTVRLLSQSENLEEMRQLIDKFRPEVRHFLKSRGRGWNYCGGTGGNIECLGDLRKIILGKNRDNHIRRKELSSLIDTLAPLSVEKRMSCFGLRSDRADVILPAALAIQMVMTELDIKDLAIPRVGLREGVLYSFYC